MVALIAVLVEEFSAPLETESGPTGIVRTCAMKNMLISTKRRCILVTFELAFGLLFEVVDFNHDCGFRMLSCLIKCTA